MGWQMERRAAGTRLVARKGHSFHHRALNSKQRLLYAGRRVYFYCTLVAKWDPPKSTFPSQTKFTPEGHDFPDQIIYPSFQIGEEGCRKNKFFFIFWGVLVFRNGFQVLIITHSPFITSLIFIQNSRGKPWPYFSDFSHFP